MAIALSSSAERGVVVGVSVGPNVGVGVVVGTRVAVGTSVAVVTSVAVGLTVNVAVGVSVHTAAVMLATCSAGGTATGHNKAG